jgi:hypothetical protein
LKARAAKGALGSGFTSDFRLTSIRIGMPLIGVRDIDQEKAGNGITASSAVCTPLFLKEEPHIIGTIAQVNGGLADGLMHFSLPLMLLGSSKNFLHQFVIVFGYGFH